MTSNETNALYRLIKQNYDYIYLKSRFLRDASIVTVGSSYAAKGIDVHLFDENTINFCCSSQDLFYDYKLVEAYLADHKYVDSVIIIVGYYDIFRDLSLEENEGTDLIRKIYWPITKSVRNNKVMVDEYDFYKGLEEFKISNCHYNDLMNEAIYMISKRANHFNDYNVRTSGVFNYQGIPWWKTPEDVKNQLGRERAALHNRFLRYRKTLVANIELLESLFTVLKKSDIKIIVCTPPFSKFYYDNLNREMICISDETWNYICNRYKAIYLDYNKSIDFEEGDFLDMDHLNNRGALKFSKSLSGVTNN